MADIFTDGIRPCAGVSFARNSGRIAGDVQAHVDYGIAWAQNGAYEQALEAWRQALVLAPDLAEAYAAMGSVYMALDCWQDAVRSYQQAIQAAPDLLECYYGLGNAYARLGEFDHAIEAFEQGCQRIPIAPALRQEAVVVCREERVTDARRLEPSPLQGRVRPNPETFDFSALLARPEERRQAVRQTENADADTLPTHTADVRIPFVDRSPAQTADASAPFADTSPAHPTDDPVRTTVSAPAPFADAEDRMADASPARVAGERIRMADTMPQYFSEEPVRIVDLQPTHLSLPETPLTAAEIARRKKIALVIGILVVIVSICLELFIVTR